MGIWNGEALDNSIMESSFENEYWQKGVTYINIKIHTNIDNKTLMKKMPTIVKMFYAVGYKLGLVCCWIHCRILIFSSDWQYTELYTVIISWAILETLQNLQMRMCHFINETIMLGPNLLVDRSLVLLHEQTALGNHFML